MAQHNQAPTAPEQSEVDLTDFLLRLQDLLVDNADIRAFLEDFACMTATKLTKTGNTIACGVTVIRQKKPVAVAESDTLARRLDGIQNSFGDGPCLATLRTRSISHVPDVQTEQRWPEYMKAAAATNVGSILALPMELNSTAEAVVNLYSTRPHGFSQDDIMAAKRLTATGAKALHLAVKMAQLRDTRDNLTAALESRATIDTAVGIIMAQNRCCRDEAFQILARASSHRNIKLRTVAAGIIAKVAGDQRISANFEE
ncbi:ANTAR domain-containing response regulator [Arthrobacter sp. ISL-95]|uniref:ANTAR domain-containing response regulator n=1 Tax=Arthrobacter sp. ISL-95 TaxID=2819116 RepID=UPI001BE7887F|nr:GAF and ANTAR domain-containing protein [Arthrobacter sp. ISL-95]MBT2585279.1 GAF and ANTAR domain-containing protein [Arthrobacter sp. ISL-95]